MTDSPAPGDVPSPDLFADIPLFREIQRVLLSSPGPVNWELARQVAVAMTSLEPGSDPAVTSADQDGFEEAVRVAELQIAGLTGLSIPTEMAHIRAVRKAEWIADNIDGLKQLVEPSAAKMQEAISRLQADESSGPGEGDPADGDALPASGAEAPAGPFDLSLGQLTPLLFGTQAGSVLGYLGQNVLGQYDIGVPRTNAAELLFVVPNIAAFERDWSLPPMEFREWVALHEVAHRFEFAGAWTREYVVSLIDDFCSTMQLDTDGLRARFESLDAADPESMQALMQGDENLFATVLDDEQRLKLNRIQSFMASAEGFADHVMHTLGRRMLTSYSRIDEAMRRYRESEQGDPVFERLLGIDMKREQYALGRAFCEQVVEAADETLLARMWDSAEALPSMPELQEPRLWLARTS